MLGPLCSAVSLAGARLCCRGPARRRVLRGCWRRSVRAGALRRRHRPAARPPGRARLHRPTCRARPPGCRPATPAARCVPPATGDRKGAGHGPRRPATRRPADLVGDAASSPRAIACAPASSSTARSCRSARGRRATAARAAGRPGAVVRSCLRWDRAPGGPARERLRRAARAFSASGAGVGAVADCRGVSAGWCCRLLAARSGEGARWGVLGREVEGAGPDRGEGVDCELVSVGVVVEHALVEDPFDHPHQRVGDAARLVLWEAVAC